MLLLELLLRLLCAQSHQAMRLLLLLLQLQLRVLLLSYRICCKISKGKRLASHHSTHLSHSPPQHVVSVLVSPIPNPVIGINTRRTRSHRARGALQSVKSASTSPGRTMKCTLIVPFHCPPAAATRTGGGAGLTSSACSELVRLS